MITWGQLQKSQIDPEKIEEAIARMIAQHNADPEAHLGPGQSLQSHKAAEIIDHLYRSIVGDKLTANETWLRTTFESVDGWTFEGFQAIPEWPGVVIWTYNVEDEEARFWAEAAGYDDFYDLSKDPIFQTVLQSPDHKKVEFYFGWTVELENAPEEGGFGFMYEGEKLKAFFDDRGQIYKKEISGVDITKRHIYRAEVKSSEKKIYYLIDGVLKTTISYGEGVPISSIGPFFWLKTLENEYKVLIITEVLLIRKI